MRDQLSLKTFFVVVAESFLLILPCKSTPHQGLTLCLDQFIEAFLLLQWDPYFKTTAKTRNQAKVFVKGGWFFMNWFIYLEGFRKGFRKGVLKRGVVLREWFICMERCRKGLIKSGLKRGMVLCEWFIYLERCRRGFTKWS